MPTRPRSLSQTGDIDTYLGFPAVGTLRFTAATVNVGTITSTGLGIGTTNPSFDLDIASVAGSGDATIRLRALGTGATDDTFVRNVLAGNTGRNFLYFGDVDDTNVGEIQYNHSDDSLRVTVNAMEALRIDSSGQLGIGVTTLDYLLHVGGAIGWTPGTSATPVNNGDVVIEATNNTTLTLKLKGSDGVVRSGTITLS